MNNEEKQDALLGAIKENNVDKVREILPHIDDIDFIYSNYINWECGTALIAAANIKDIHYEIVELLINARADVNLKKFISGRPARALFYAAENGRADIVKLLLDNDANTETKNCHWYTPLLIAAMKGYQEVVTLLLDYNANIEATDRNNDNVLYYAAYSGNINIIKLLINKGIKFESIYRLDQLLFNVIEKNFIEVLQWLIDQGADINTRIVSISYEIKLSKLSQLRTPEPSSEEIPISLSILKILISNGLNIGSTYWFDNEDKYILDTAKLVDSLFDSPDELKIVYAKIDLEVFISRFSFYLKRYEGDFNEFYKIVTDFFANYSHYLKNNDENINSQIYEKTVDLMIDKYISYIKENGLDLQQQIEKFNSNFFIPELMKDKILTLLLQAQDDFNLKCASIFSLSLKNIYKDVSAILSVPITMIGEDYIEASNDEYSGDISDSIKNLFKFYDENSDLKSQYLKDYFTRNIVEDKNSFATKVTAANIQIFRKYMALIIEECPIEHIFDLFEMPLPNSLVDFIDNYFVNYNNFIRDNAETSFLGDITD